jgi:starch phosphorylase
MGGKTYRSVMYDLQVTGYQGRTNRLHLFDLETVSDTIIKNGIDFDKKDIGGKSDTFSVPG